MIELDPIVNNFVIALLGGTLSVILLAFSPFIKSIEKDVPSGGGAESELAGPSLKQPAPILGAALGCIVVVASILYFGPFEMRWLWFILGIFAAPFLAGFLSGLFSILIPKRLRMRLRID